MDLLNHYDDSESENEQGIEKEKPLKRTSVDRIESSKKQKRGKVTLIQPHESSHKNLFERRQPHIQGNWAGHVFITIPKKFAAVLESQQQRAADWWKDCLEGDDWTGPMLLHKQAGADDSSFSGMHVSLSRPFYLQRGSIDSFVNTLRERLKYTEKGCFRLQYGGTKLLTNDENTRTFLVWPIRDSDGFLTALVKDVDAVLERYGAPLYYRPAQFHVSVASIPRGSSDTVISTRKQDEGDESVVIPVVDIQCTFGTTEEFSIPLGSAIIR